MSHLWGMDSAYPKSADEFASLAGQGIGFYGGYVGGSALHTWSKDDFAALAASGMKILAYWVGPLGTDPGYDQGVSDGNACLSALQERGLSGWVVDDAESGVVRRQWSQGFVDALHAGSCSVRVYGSPDTLKGMGDIYDSWYLAWYPTSGMAAQTFLNEIIDWDVWQFASGPDVDYNVARDDIPFTDFNA